MWTDNKAPSLEEMEVMAHAIFERLPTTFRQLCEGVIIRVDDFPTDEVLDEMQAQSEFDLLGRSLDADLVSTGDDLQSE